MCRIIAIDLLHSQVSWTVGYTLLLGFHFSAHERLGVLPAHLILRLIECSIGAIVERFRVFMNIEVRRYEQTDTSLSFSLSLSQLPFECGSSNHQARTYRECLNTAAVVVERRAIPETNVDR